MAMSPISSYTPTRITGLTSGMDTQMLVSNLMKSEQMKLDRVFQKTTTLEWKRDAYSGINSKMREFRDKFMSVLSPDNVLSKNAYRAYNVNYTENKYLDIQATSNATISKHDITGVLLAEQATLDGVQYRNRHVSIFSKGGENIVATTKGSQAVEGSDTLEDVFGLAEGKQISFSINGEVFTFEHDETISKVMFEVNSSLDAHVNMKLDPEGLVTITNKQTGPNATLQTKNITGPSVFGEDGVFGWHGKVEPENRIDSQITTLKEMEAITGKLYGFENGELSFKVNGDLVTINEEMSLDEAIEHINSTLTSATVAYDSKTDRFSVRSTESGAASKLELENVTGNVFGEDGLLNGIEEGLTNKYDEINRREDTLAAVADKMGIDLQLDPHGKFSFTITQGEESKDFSFDPSKTTIQKMMDTVNGDPDVNVRLSYSQITDKFVFTSGETGEKAEITVSNKNGTNAFGGADSFFGIEEGSATGSDAILYIDGEEVKQSSNNFVLDGIEFNLKMNLDPTIGTEEDARINFSISQDIDGVVEKVKVFIEDYNALVKELNDTVTEARDFDYEPLTQEELSVLSEKEIEQWEERAKKGLLRNDTAISSLLTQMRNSLFEKVGDTGLSAHDIGLTTGDWQNRGQISFDEAKFRKALEANPDAVGEVMAARSDSSNKVTAREDSGIIARFYDQMTSMQNTLSQTNIKNTEEAILTNERQMSEMLDRMYRMEERYYLQFAQMESLMSEYQQQSQWLTQQLASLTTS